MGVYICRALSRVYLCSGSAGGRMWEEECQVRGALAVVLRCGRAAGVAPVRLARAGDGYRARFCSRSALYGRVLVALLSLYPVAVDALGLDIMNLVAMYTRSELVSKMDLHLPQSFFLLFTFVINSLANRNFVYSMFGCLTVLQKINTNFNVRTETKHSVLSVIIVTGYCLIQIWDMSHEFKYCQDVVVVYLRFIAYLKYPMLIVMMIQVALLYFEIHKALEAIAEDLEGLIYAADDNKEEAKRCLRELNRRFLTVCDVSTQMNKHTGLFCVIVFVFNILTMIDTSSYIAMHFIKNGYKIADWWYISRHLVWFTQEVFRPILFYEAFHQINNEKTKIKYIMAKVMYQWTGCGELLCEELELGAQQLLAHAAPVAPFGMLHYSRALLLTTFSVVMTYAIVELQFKIVSVQPSNQDIQPLPFNTTLI
ncbi:unnamed protein product [Colias eurytheme]|nr:unnamed protein product [Colias eurytheme]